jgi:dTDP-glucose 4,6-dehydratase
MKVLIIGGSNFIGWRLVQLYGKTEHEVTIFNRGNHVRTYPEGMCHIIGDRNDTELLQNIVNENKFDVVYDMCAFNGEHIKDVVSVFNGNVGRYIFISSAAGYMDNQILPLKETDVCGFHHQWGAYGSGKFECDCRFLEAYKEDKFPITIVRPSYVYGLENSIDRETLLFHRITNEMPLLVPYSGEGVIQLGYVDDLCDALYTIAKSDKGYGEIYNVSGNEYLTLNGLVSLVSDIVGKKAKVYHVNPEELGFTQRELFPFENNTYFTSIEKFCKMFDWFPKMSLKEGLKQSYIAWKENPNRIRTKTENETKAIRIMKSKGVIE